VKDCAQVFHNAMLYNRHGSQIYSYAEQLEQVLKDQLDRLAEAGDIKKEDAELPDLGPLPPPSPELLPAKAELDDDEISASEPEEEDVSVSEASEGSDDEEDEDLDAKKRRNSGSGRGRRTKRRGSSQPRATRRRTPRDIKEEDAEEETSGKKARDDPRRKRGRPPRVDTPVETRIKNVLKALRKLKDHKGITRMISFEKLPEKKEFPEYYKEIQKPIALDAIRVCIL
jgi:chromatin structure-remodeling complex subunit RSC1/2